MARKTRLLTTCHGPSNHSLHSPIRQQSSDVRFLASKTCFPETYAHYPVTQMNNRIFPIAALALSLSIFCVSLSAVESVVQDMENAANAFLDSLTKELKARATFPMEMEGERTNWHFVPITGERKGVDLKDLNDVQEKRLTDLLNASLSAIGHTKVKKIQESESILFMLEKSDHRDPELYYTSIFGKPSSEGAWGWRFEGHHLSLNFTVVDGKLLSTTPNFWGANPAKVLSGPQKGARILEAEEDLARAFLLSLDKDQHRKAVIADKAPKDIYSGDDPKVYPLGNAGISVADLNAKQAKKLNQLIDVYLNNMPAGVARERRTKFEADGMDRVVFAWAGSAEVGEAHYYRIQGPSFLIEYDNVQNKANHIHAAWRDFDGDFGRDIIWEHHKHSH